MEYLVWDIQDSQKNVNIKVDSELTLCIVEVT